MSRPLLADLAIDASEQGTPLTRRHRKKDGTIIDVEVIGHHTSFGEWNARFAILTDVTERMRTEEALRRSRESFQRLFEEAPFGMAILAGGVGFTRVNRALCTMLGYAKEELSGLSFDRFIHPADMDAHLAAADEFFAGTRWSFKVEARYFRKVGDPLWGSLTVERIDDSTGQMLFVLVMVEDISERRRAAEELERMIDALTDAPVERQDPERADPDLCLLQEDPRRQGLLAPGRGLRAGPLGGRVLPWHLPRLCEELLREMSFYRR